LGWRVVQEYDTNPLASDSDDEKRIFKVEARASWKYKADKSKKTKSARNWPYRKQRMFTETSPGSQQLVGRQGRRPGLCFACGKMGHWRGATECPKRNTNNKISNDLFTCVNRENIYDGCCDCNLSNSEGDVLHILYLNEKYVEEHKICSQLRFVEEQEDTVVSPVSRLKNCVNKCKEASDSAYIIQVVEKGYMLPLKEVPTRVVLRSNRSARDNIKFVEEEIERLLTGFLRFKELSNLLCKDVEFKIDYIILKIEKSKTDIYRSGKEVLIPKGCSVACPYSILQRYMTAAYLSVISDSYPFKPAFRSKGKSSLIKLYKKISYTRAG
jgi:hypothetical protein